MTFINQVYDAPSPTTTSLYHIRLFRLLNWMYVIKTFTPKSIVVDIDGWNFSMLVGLLMDNPLLALLSQKIGKRTTSSCYSFSVQYWSRFKSIAIYKSELLLILMIVLVIAHVIACLLRDNYRINTVSPICHLTVYWCPCRVSKKSRMLPLW
jgi:hypothetical protein